jgi:glycosyltransferase involved in cell wall biosynthesis
MSASHSEQPADGGSPDGIRPVSVSVVVPAYNCAGTVGDMLNALTHQSQPPPDTEIIVVDNGSTDDTVAIARRFPVTLLEEAKRGPAAARNRGLHAARGEIIAHLDADTLPTRRWLAEITAPFADPQVILVGGRTTSFQPTTPAQRFYASYRRRDTEDCLDRAVFPFVSSTNMAVRRTAALTIGGWAEDLLTAEDMDFCYRLVKEYPSPIHFQPGALLFHRDRDTRKGLCRQAFTYGEGLAQLSFRYPEATKWSVTQALGVARHLAAVSLRPFAVRWAQMSGAATAEDVEYTQYHRLWNWCYWRGFLSMVRHREWR